jgi:hypothetical protein
MSSAVDQVSAVTSLTCLLDGVTLLYAAPVTRISGVVLLQRNHRIEYGKELSERFKAGQKRSTVAALKYTQIDKYY